VSSFPSSHERGRGDHGWVLFRELSPLVVAGIVIARSATAIVVEIGNMRVNGEIHALEVLGVNLDRLIVLPRLLGMLISVPLLTVVFCAAAFWGGYWAAELSGLLESNFKLARLRRRWTSPCSATCSCVPVLRLRDRNGLVPPRIRGESVVDGSAAAGDARRRGGPDALLHRGYRPLPRGAVDMTSVLSARGLTVGSEVQSTFATSHWRSLGRSGGRHGRWDEGSRPLLEMLAGLKRPEAGEIAWGDISSGVFDERPGSPAVTGRCGGCGSRWVLCRQAPP